MRKNKTKKQKKISVSNDDLDDDSNESDGVNDTNKNNDLSDNSNKNDDTGKKHICKKCKTEFDRKYDLERHMNRMKDCVTGDKINKSKKSMVVKIVNIDSQEKMH